jgi:tetratricopeptide (TPR) repeat protein
MRVEDRALLLNSYGSIQTVIGQQTGDPGPLEEAVAAYRLALAELTRERVPLDWAGTQNNLGNALLSLGQRESGTARLEEAVAAYRLALAERTRERVPLHWATTQNNLGNALLRLGERESGTARLEEAVAAYDGAIEIFTDSHAIHYEGHCRAARARALRLMDQRKPSKPEPSSDDFA